MLSRGAESRLLPFWELIHRQLEVAHAITPVSYTHLDVYKRQAIQRRYPHDAATGFDAGDLRGGLWVEVPVSPPLNMEKLP